MLNHILLIITLFHFAKTVTIVAANYGIWNFLLKVLNYSAVAVAMLTAIVCRFVGMLSWTLKSDFI